MKKFQPNKLKPKSEKCVFIGYQKKLLGTPSITDLKARHLLLRMDLLEKEFLSKEVSGRKVEHDEVTPLEPESSAAREDVSMMPAPTREEVNDDDLQIKLLLNFVGPQGHVTHQNGMATLS